MIKTCDSSCFELKIYKNHLYLSVQDEPTNNLDIESIDALAEAINEFTGGEQVLGSNLDLVVCF